MRPAAAYDSSKNPNFSGFAKFRIRGAIMDSLRESDWGSRSIRRRGREITEVTARLEGKLGRHPVESEIAAEMDLEVDHLRKITAQLDGLHLVGQQTMVSNDSGELMDIIESAPDLGRSRPVRPLSSRRTEGAPCPRPSLSSAKREQLILSLYLSRGADDEGDLRGGGSGAVSHLADPPGIDEKT